MPWITRSQKSDYERLKDLEDRADEAIQDAEKSYDRKIRRLERSHYERIDDLRQDFEDELREARNENAAELTSLKDEVASLEASNEFLSTKVNDARGLAKREMALAERTVELEARERASEKEQKTLEKAQKDLETSKLAGEKCLAEDRKELEKILDGKNGAHYKQGYADGLSDGLRQTAELTKDANSKVFQLAEKALSKDVTPIVVNAAPAPRDKQGK